MISTQQLIPIFPEHHHISFPLPPRDTCQRVHDWLLLSFTSYVLQSFLPSEPPSPHTPPSSSSHSDNLSTIHPKTLFLSPAPTPCILANHTLSTLYLLPQWFYPGTFFSPPSLPVLLLPCKDLWSSNFLSSKCQQQQQTTWVESKSVLCADE